MSGWDHVKVRHIELGDDERAVVNVLAGRMRVERVVPPAGERYAFDREVWPLDVEVYVSPTGRSARVWVNGKEVRR